MKNQVLTKPTKNNTLEISVANSEPKTLYMYGTITKGKGNKTTTHRAVVAGVQTSKTAMRIGLSICSKKDKFIKAKGKAIATGRAKSSSELQDVLYLTDDTNVAKQFIAKAITLVTPKEKK